ncbi:beta-aspartyl-peptidase [Nissabacter sp. SGAir0207]|uniref:beta-aspartyl-peptidase n=1 Tax=Nissabacter sp. SGAir0207 TaxID=2126321 RepID=UPI0010CD3FFF|nr:beta-aspartyl-peptidase [Nissabacter sp. SGAir0207]QCR37924.1 beta-aspartyl-peptidase [Nissabacter sp. SGAir0207]
MDLSMVGGVLLRGANVYTPQALGRQDLLVIAGKIVALAPHIAPESLPGCEVVDLAGHCLCPGLIDQHVHLIGGGGEAGPHTRTPEVRLSRLVEAGITSVVGLLGTDSVTRHPESLLAKVRALESEGISAWMLTGAYGIPSPTITGSVERDVALIDKVIGVKCAISDHRSAAPAPAALANLAAQARVGGLLGGKAGVSVFHLGNSPRLLAPLEAILRDSDVPIGKLLPTHVNRSTTLFTAALEFARAGGHIDLTSGIETPFSAAEGVARAVAANVPLARLSISSDGNGSQPVFDEQGNLQGIGVAGFTSLPQALRELVQCHGFTLAEALCPFTCNVAAFLGLSMKGELLPGRDADLLVLTPDLAIDQVWAKGKRLVENGKACVKGTFEE